MTPELEVLRRLQAFEREAAAVQARLAALPQRRAEVAATVDAARRHLTAAHAEMDDLQTKRRKGEGEASTLQARLEKYRAQLMTVTTTRELEAMQHEIDTVDGQLKALEDEVIGWMMQIDELEPQVTAAEAAVRDAVDAADVAMAQLATDEQKDKLELAACQGHVQAEREALTPATLALYDRASRRYPLSAIAELKGELCTACNVRLRPMVVSDIRRRGALVQCDSCARLLVYVAPPSLPEAPVAP
jgi:predicted  nucleic acid-binding Zn-ribbon protein